MSRKPKVLIVDDDCHIRAMLQMALELDYEVFQATNEASCLQIVQTQMINICLLDLHIGTEDGMQILKKIVDMDNRVSVIVITAYGSIKSSVEAMRSGAYTYLAKPLDLDELYLIIERALQHQALTDEVHMLKRELEEKEGVHGLIGKSEPMIRMYEQINRIKDTNISVVIIGESGTGKELVAHALHYASCRKDAPFVALNCAAIPAELLEEEMFGHKKGAYTGAISDSKGKFEYANGGSLFLDEIAEMPLPLQSKLLRVLESKEYYPIGSNEKRSIDVRIIAATNRDLKACVGKKEFRQDLFFRLSVITLTIPPLRERRTDIPLLTQHFLAQYNRKHHKHILGLSGGAKNALLRYDYPGNVRELINIIEYSMIFANTDYIHTCDLPANVSALNARDASGDSQSDLPDAVMTLAEAEKAAIISALHQTRGHIGKAAALLAISDKGLRNKIVSYGIDAKGFDESEAH